MPKFIKKRKTYNTETSTLIHEWWNHKGRDDLQCIEQDLYRRQDGEYWFRVFGGAATPYAETRRPYSTSWEGAVPVSEYEAYEYLERKQEVALIEEHFPHYLEDEKEPTSSRDLGFISLALKIRDTNLEPLIKRLKMPEGEIESLLWKYSEHGRDSLLFLTLVDPKNAGPLLEMIKE